MVVEIPFIFHSECLFHILHPLPSHPHVRHVRHDISSAGRSLPGVYTSINNSPYQMCVHSGRTICRYMAAAVQDAWVYVTRLFFFISAKKVLFIAFFWRPSTHYTLILYSYIYIYTPSRAPRTRINTCCIMDQPHMPTRSITTTI